MSNIIVEIEQGKLRGKVANSLNGNPYYSFKGIPYAKPPIGELRFAVPQPPEPWEGIRDGTKNCNICAQLDKETKTVIGDEDCLFLNVYTPKLPSAESTLLPVMVFIHGGGFIYGHGTDDSAHGPDYLVEKDVVLVSINYRLGILGFLSLDRKEAPGNMGLRDQVQALKWVQQNIAKFGGDPKNVTIFGISAGGASVEYLLLSPMAKGLFHKAIAQSGSSLLHWARNENVKKLASKVPAIHGKTITDDESLLKYLKEMSTEDLINASMSVLASEDWKGGIYFGFVPTIERPGNWEPFLNTSTYELLVRGEFTKVPFMTGFCSREGLLCFIAGPDSTVLKLSKEKIFLNHFPFKLDSNEKVKVEAELKSIYLEGKKIYKDADAFAIDFFSDVDFLGGCYVAAALIVKQNNPVYIYEFAYDGNLNYLKKCHNIEREGACHGDDGGYLVKSSKLTAPLTDDDNYVREAMNVMWTNFAKYGEPTPNMSQLTPVTWEPATKTQLSCFVIDKMPAMKYEIYPERMKLYQQLYEKNNGTS